MVFSRCIHRFSSLSPMSWAFAESGGCLINCNTLIDVPSHFAGLDLGQTLKCLATVVSVWDLISV